MATVSTETIHFDGQVFKKRVRCNRDGLFRIKYPPAVVKILGEPEEAVAETLDAAEKEFAQRLWEFKKARTSTRKVILYRVELQVDIWPKDGQEGLKRKDISFAHGLGVTVWADVFTETCVQLGDNGARYTYDRVDSGLPPSICNGGSFGVRVAQGHRESRCMDWTPEREAFFCRVAEAMEALALRLHEMTKDGADDLARIADTWSGSLLPGARDERTET